jgi:small subunit ribosomal protein S14
MTRKSVVARDAKKQKMVDRFASKRLALKEAFENPKNSYEEKMAAFEKLQKLPRNSSPSRITRRCSLTGRPHAVYRKFGLSRIKLREAAMRGDIPGLVKSSW